MSTSSTEQVRYLPAGDQGLVVEFGNVIDPTVNRRVHDLAQAITDAKLTGILDLVPTYRSLLVMYDPLSHSYNGMKFTLSSLLEGMTESELASPKVVEIPVIYDAEYGPDLDFVCQHSGLSHKEVIEIHSNATYLVYMLGFTPGFPYLGGMDDRIATPRLKTPRTSIPAGSVGIAEKQTGVYPIESPGGWQLIGYTPIKLFDPAREEPVLLEPGNYVRFLPVDDATAKEIEEQVASGTYEFKISEYAG